MGSSLLLFGRRIAAAESETADVAGIALRRGRDVYVGFRLRVGEIVGTAMTA